MEEFAEKVQSSGDELGTAAATDTSHQDLHEPAHECLHALDTRIGLERFEKEIEVHRLLVRFAETRVDEGSV